MTFELVVAKLEGSLSLKLSSEMGKGSLRLGESVFQQTELYEDQRRAAK